MEDQEKKALELENLEAAELEEEELEDVSGGAGNTNSCTNINCPCQE
jgi:natural product precursor